MRDVKIGALLENSLGQFTKVINVRNGVYGISGWAARKVAEKAQTVTTHMNGYGLRMNGVRVASAKDTDNAAPAKASVTKPAKASKPAKAKKPKSTIAKPAVRKAAKRAQAAQKPASKAKGASK